MHEEMQMSVRKAVAATGLAAVTVAGGVVGASLIGTADAAAPSPSPTTVGGSNEDTTHEAGESAAREAAENNGSAGFEGRHHGGPNETAAHEAGESAAREAAENDGSARARGGSNEDSAHEAGESAAREAAEGQESGSSTPEAPATTPSPTASPSV
jgi:hypothetical protein